MMVGGKYLAAPCSGQARGFLSFSASMPYHHLCKTYQNGLENTSRNLIAVENDLEAQVYTHFPSQRLGGCGASLRITFFS